MTVSKARPRRAVSGEERPPGERGPATGAPGDARTYDELRVPAHGDDRAVHRPEEPLHDDLHVPLRGALREDRAVRTSARTGTHTRADPQRSKLALTRVSGNAALVRGSSLAENAQAALLITVH